MLEVTIFKTNHSGQREAKKLLDYIKNSDVFSIEAEGSTESFARNEEESWNWIITSGISRSRYSGFLDQNIGLQNMAVPIREYVRKLSDYLFIGKVPRYFFERWQNDEEPKRLNELARKGETQFIQGIKLIQQNNKDDGILLCYKSEKMQHEAILERDKNGAQNLVRAETIIRDTYPKVSGKNTLRLGIQIGRGHRPEIYSAIPMNVIDLTGECGPQEAILGKIDDLMWDEAPINRLAPLFIEVAPYITQWLKTQPNL